MNIVMLSGRLVRDPELRMVSGDKSVCSFSIAVDKFRKGEDRSADFFSCNAWAHTANFINKYFTKGMWIEISGRLTSRNWEDKSGNRRTSVEVLVTEAGFGGGNKGSARQDDGLHQYDDETPPRALQSVADTVQPDDDISLPFDLE